MFFHNLKYTLKTLFRNKALVFWTLAFPLIMATFFNMAFSNVVEEEKLKVFDIAIIDNNEFNNNMIYKEAFRSLSDTNNPDRLFNITYTDTNTASKLLEDGKIIGYLELNNNLPKLTFNSNGINETILKYVVDEISDTKNMIIDNTYITNSINLKNIASDKLDYMMIEYYTLIAMTCLYGGTLGMYAINKALPYLKGNGKRVAISPSKKTSIITSSLVGAYIVQVIGLILLFLYTICILNIDYGNNFLLITLLSLIGSLTGIAFGLAIGVYVKSSENNKIGVLIGITMFGCFLSGMMGVTMKYIVDKYVPLVNKLNPANMITDGFYSLYYYDSLNRFYSNIISLIIVTIILFILSINKLRRDSYDSI